MRRHLDHYDVNIMEMALKHNLDILKATSEIATVAEKGHCKIILSYCEKIFEINKKIFMSDPRSLCRDPLIIISGSKIISQEPYKISGDPDIIFSDLRHNKSGTDMNNFCSLSSIILWQYVPY